MSAYSFAAMWRDAQTTRQSKPCLFNIEHLFLEMSVQRVTTTVTTIEQESAWSELDGFQNRSETTVALPVTKGAVMVNRKPTEPLDKVRVSGILRRCTADNRGKLVGKGETEQ